MKKAQVEIELDEALGLAVKRLRQHKGMTQTALAERAQVSQPWVSLTENAQRNKRPSLGILQRIALSLGLSGLSHLISFAEEMTSISSTLIDVEEFISKAK